MSKVNQIQRKILELDGGAFQKLADDYLAKLGYSPVIPIGSVIGSNKTKKGTPDTLVPLENGKYLLAEHTTQQSRVGEKLLGDLRKCFNEKKTGISVEKIERVILSSTADLDAASVEALRKEAQTHRVKLDIISLQALSYALLESYPGLAEDHLRVKVDTRQILASDVFVASYNRNKLATPLDTAFRFREEEVGHVLKNLEEGDLVVVSGSPGVGKSRLALECCRRFVEARPDYEVRCIFNRGTDIYNDLQIHFSEPGHFLIFVDDANRLTGFDYVLQKMLDQRTDQRIKIVATVREYALEKIREASRKVGGAREVLVAPFTDEEIKEFVEIEFEILNPRFLDRIVDVAKGNPRLAVMVSLVAKEADYLQSIRDVSSVYEVYYSSIREDLEGLGEPNLLKVAAIVAFYRAVDRTNAEQMQQIREAFGVNPEVFWEMAWRLHRREVLAMYEDEVVKPSEQILSTYLFYLAFFKERVLDFGTFFAYFFPGQRHRIVDAVNPVLNAFDSESILAVMEPAVRATLARYEEEGDVNGLLHLMDQYWFHLETESLVYIKKQVHTLEKETVDLDHLSFKPASGLTSPSILSILSSFCYAREPVFKIALDLILDYAEKRPGEIPHVLHVLTEDFGIKHNSYLWEYRTQTVVVDQVWIRADEGNSPLFARLFLSIARAYLHVHFDGTESKKPGVITIYNFDVHPTESLLALRRQMWERILALAAKETLQAWVFMLLRDYSLFVRRGKVPEALEADAKVLLPYIVENLDGDDLVRCIAVRDYLDLLEEREVEFNPAIRTRFESDAFTLYNLLILDRRELRNSGLSYSEYREQQIQEIQDYFSGFDLAAYEQFFTACLEILGVVPSDHEKSQVRRSVYDVLRTLAEKDGMLFTEVLSRYLEMGEPLSLWRVPVHELIVAVGSDEAHALLTRHAFPRRNGWMMEYYFVLPQKDVTKDRLNSLYALYRESEPEYLGRGFDYLLKFQIVDDRVVPKVVEILLDRARTDTNFGAAFTMLFNPLIEVNKKIKEVFAGDVDLLVRAYLFINSGKGLQDHNSETFNQILDLAPDFVETYVDAMYGANEWLSRHDDSRNYALLWLRDDHAEVMGRATMRVLERERGRISLGYSLLQGFFTLTQGEKSNDEVRERQDRFLRDLICKHSRDNELMLILFGVIADFVPDRRRPFVALFLEYNQQFEDFEALPLQPNGASWSGSGVPVFLAKADYLQSLLPLMDSVDLLEHKHHVEQMVRGERAWAEHYKKRDFIGH